MLSGQFWKAFLHVTLVLYGIVTGIISYGGREALHPAASFSAKRWSWELICELQSNQNGLFLTTSTMPEDHCRC